MKRYRDVGPWTFYEERPEALWDWRTLEILYELNFFQRIYYRVFRNTAPWTKKDGQ